VRILETPAFSPNAVQTMSPARVKNDLPFELTRVVLRSNDGRYWTAERLAANSEGTAAPVVTTQEVSKLLGTMYNDHRPIAVSTASSKRARPGTPQTTDLILALNRQLGRTSAIQDGIFESVLSAMLSVRGELDPSMFVAIAAPSPDSLPVEEADHVASVRYVMGTMP
ncbi:MAG: hypothetical protein AAGJ83_08125, partial [Planctomycetota bacterium]